MTLSNLVGFSSSFIIPPFFSDHLLDRAVIFRVIFDERSGDDQGWCWEKGANEEDELGMEFGNMAKAIQISC